ncbi:MULTISPECIES: hypothetical protein [unclassified Amycolatopsis]|nr:hypothetical protein [Amycolatopsis sp. DSM 110486]QYN19146.1 hypothetical protein K1T34_41880 [Amycolatopsis sp. DSM 110486]
MEAGRAPVLAMGGGIHHAALLWRDGINAAPGTVGRFERAARARGTPS